MKEYATPLSERLRQSEIHRRKYKTDANYRLRCLNRGRAAQGLRPRTNLHEIMSPDAIKCAASEQAAKRRRAKNGRYVQEEA